MRLYVGIRIGRACSYSGEVWIRMQPLSEAYIRMHKAVGREAKKKPPARGLYHLLNIILDHLFNPVDPTVFQLT